MAQRLPAYYYCSAQEIEIFGLTEPGVPIDADLGDPDIRQKPTIFLTPGTQPAAGFTPMSQAEIDALLNGEEVDDEVTGGSVAPPATNDAATEPYTPPPLPGHRWTGENQSAFLAALAEGYTVESACRSVGLSVQSAYKLRRSASGAAFALGWNASLLQYRGKLADTLISRAMDGQKVVTTRADGKQVIRHFFDNRLALATLTRLDRLADEAKADGAFESARMIAQDFDAYLDIIRAGASPARAGLFLARRTTLELPDMAGDDSDEEEATLADAAAAVWSSPQLAPVAALARADLYTRTGASLPQEIDVSDLDYDQRADWTAEQWQRAHASGLLAPTAGSSSPSPFGSSVVENALRAEREACPEHGRGASTSLGNGSRQARTEREDEEEGKEIEAHGNPNPPKPPRPTSGIEGRIWIDPEDDSLMTNFPPPEDFVGYQSHVWGHPAYERTLSWDEEERVEARRTAQMIEVSGPDAAVRDQWFAQVEDGTSDVLALYAPLLATKAGPVKAIDVEAPEECATVEALPPPNRKSRRTAAARRRTRRKAGDAGAESAHAA